MSSRKSRILVTGAVGQVGSELTLALRDRYGGADVIAGVHRTKPGRTLLESGPCEYLDVTREDTVRRVVADHGIAVVYHLAALLSAVGEDRPAECWEVNISGLKNVLDVAVDLEVEMVFVPSSIAVFGPDAPPDSTPNETVLRPTTMYGITKVAGELLADYYVDRFGLDCRGVRWPGLISHETEPGGGTTDYAVEMYRAAATGNDYECFVRADTLLPMMYMPDAIKSAIDLMDAPLADLQRHCTYNVTAMSFSAEELAASIRMSIPSFSVTYRPDSRQAIADSWPNSLDDSAARREWGWKPSFDLAAMTSDMLSALASKLGSGLPDGHGGARDGVG